MKLNKIFYKMFKMMKILQIIILIKILINNKVFIIYYNKINNMKQK